MHHGTVTVLTGPMYSGKSTRLLEKVRRSDLGRKKFMLIKPATDDRYAISHVVSHDQRSYPCDVVDSTLSIRPLVPSGTEIVFIDEAQFFSFTLVNDVAYLAAGGIDVVLAGLDLDFRGHPFPVMVDLVFGAEKVVKLSAICDVCGADASRSQRVADGRPILCGDTVAVGGVESYEARCRSCFVQSNTSGSDSVREEVKDTACELSS